jgi:hypothetical protein
VSLAPWSPPLEPDSPLQVPWYLDSQPRRSLRDSSHLWLPTRGPGSSIAPTAVLDGPPPHEWPASLIADVRRPRQPAPAGTTPPLPLRPPPAGGQGVVVPVTPPENPHRMVTRAKDGFQVLPDRLILAATTTSSTSSPIPSSVCAAFTDPNWRAAMEDEYGGLMSNGTWDLVPLPQAPMSSPTNGSSRTSSALTGPSIATRLAGSFGVSLSASKSTTMRLSARL